MNGPRELLAALLQYVAASTAAVQSATAWVQWRIVYPLTDTVGSWIVQVDAVMQQFVLGYVLLVQRFIVGYVQTLEHLFLPVFNDMAMATFSTMDAVTVVALYSVYVWTEPAIQFVQSVIPVPSVETLIEGDVPGGVTVWLVVLFALATYAFVYYQYPTHEDWVATVFSIVLPFLSQWLWKSD